MTRLLRKLGDGVLRGDFQSEQIGVAEALRKVRFSLVEGVSKGSSCGSNPATGRCSSGLSQGCVPIGVRRVLVSEGIECAEGDDRERQSIVQW